MELPERLHLLVEHLGKALVEALASDPKCQELTRQIQDEGFDVAVAMEATIALHQREVEAAGPEAEDQEPSSPKPAAPPVETPRSAWSESDKAFLKTFRISLD